jgi:hypothetical protein
LLVGYRPVDGDRLKTFCDSLHVLLTYSFVKSYLNLFLPKTNYFGLCSLFLGADPTIKDDTGHNASSYTREQSIMNIINKHAIKVNI